MPDILSLARPHLQALKPYSSARDEFRGNADAWLDANEYPEETGFNRYPDSRHDTLREQLSVLYGISDKELFVGNGSDEAIDLIASPEGREFALDIMTFKSCLSPGTSALVFFHNALGVEL